MAKKLAETFSLMYSKSEQLKLYFINNNTKDAIKFNPIYDYENKPINKATLKLVLGELGITEVPYEKLYKNKNAEESPYDNVEVDNKLDYSNVAYPKGTSGFLPGNKKPLIAVNPTSNYKDFVIFHEVAHILLHKEKNIPKETKELEANLVSFLVVNQFNKKDNMLNIIKYFGIRLVDIPFDSCVKCMKTANDVLTIIKENMLYDF